MPICIHRKGAALLSLLLASHVFGAAPAGGTEPSAEADFRFSCSSCHGEDGRGAGAKTFGLSVAPPDLTMLSARNNGRFPREKLRRVIDGREDIRNHVDREMPVWGLIFQMGTDEGFGGADAVSSTVRQRIERLIDFIETLQR